jgi:uncharacterized protein YecT (DUF1311 family)
MKLRLLAPTLVRPWLALLVCALQLALTAEPAHAQSRKPTQKEVALIRDCATRTREDLDKAEQQCLFKLVADKCSDNGAAADRAVVDCYDIEASIWDVMLNEKYKALLEILDDEQTSKARAMQRAWAAYRDTTCGFYGDKIRGTMSNVMIAACKTRETAKRAMLLMFFGRL